jgi:mono/diheme cytochrome c family protein
MCAALAVATACGGARRGEPIGAPVVPATEPARRGQLVFMHHCHPCHPGGEAGLGPSLNDKPAPAFLLRTQVRLGLGVMPAFPPGQIDDRALDDLVAFLVVLRATPE